LRERQAVGDIIELDVPARRLELCVDPEELERQEAENRTGVLVATVRDPKVKAPAPD
jgi:dihydroxyacid dehydratase/phosphogluconate dehydratase